MIERIERDRISADAGPRKQMSAVSCEARNRAARAEPRAATLRELLPHDLADDAEAPRPRRR